MISKISSTNIGAISALKGYRAQFLYSLLRILDYKSFEAEFHPEGEFEDLDIYSDKGEIIEIIQIKNLSNTLNLSNILSNKEKNSFLLRALKVIKKNKRTKIKLVSYGELSEDIKNLKQTKYSKNLIKKLKGYGLNENEIKILQGNFDYEIVNEKSVKEAIITNIGKWEKFVNLKITLDLLTYWIYFAAEKQYTITPVRFKEQFDKITLFQKERINFNDTYNFLIKTLEHEIETENKEHLKSDFYRGISVTYKHILADIDIIRIEKLKLIKESFNKSNIAFIHGASGQGKTTLAYRYLHENCSNTTVFELKYLPEDVSVIHKVISSLEGISKGIRFPITIFIDVEPGNREWVKVLVELSSKKNFQFLVTIREEDWNAIQVWDKFLFSEIELLFDQKEAELLYESLNDYNKDLKFLDFTDAWDNFGERGPLLEFVYLITQNQSLEAKLKAQINKIKGDPINGKEKIRLLRYIVLADCFGSKIKLNDFNEVLQLRNDIFFFLDLLQKEYLIRLSEDRFYIIGLHPVRSNIIRYLLFDSEINVESDYAITAISFISDNTIFNFLRNAFRYSNLHPHKLLEKLKGFNPPKWQTYLQIFKSLLWKGIDDYLNKNISVLNKIYNDYNDSWIIVVNFNFAGVIEDGGMMGNSDLFTEEQRQYAKTVNQSFSDKKEVFIYCLQWINNINQINITPKGSREWDSMSIFLFWLHFLKKDNIKINFELHDLNKELLNQPIDVLAHLVFALKIFNSLSLDINTVEEIFLKKLSSLCNIISIEHKKDSINCQYLFDVIDEKTDPEESDFIHSKSMKIIRLLRYAFPQKKLYCTKGIGHQISFLPNSHDSSIKRVPQKNLPLEELVEINSTYINLFNYTKRPEAWKEYVNSVIERRLLLSEVLSKMVKAFILTHKLKNLQPLAEYVSDYSQNNRKLIQENSIPMLPQLITDKWGTYGEGSTKKIKSNFNNTSSVNDNIELKQILSVKRYDNYRELYRNFDNSIRNFLWQSAENIFRKIKIFLKEDVSGIKDSFRFSLVGNLFSAYEFVEKYHNSFRTHFEKFVDPDVLNSLEKNERENISILCFLYRQFMLSDTFLTGNVSKVAIHSFNEMEISLKRKITNTLKQLSKQFEYHFKVEFDEANNRCIIIVNTHDVFQSVEALKIIYDSLHEIIKELEITSIKHLILNNKYPEFNIISLVSGKTINNKYYVFKMYNLREKRFEELETFNLVPFDIPVSIAGKYNIESWNNILSEFENLDKLLENVSATFHLAFHFSQLKYFENKEIKEYNRKILEDHIEKTGKALTKALQVGLDLFTMYTVLSNDNKIQFDDETEKSEFYQILVDSYENFYPNEDLYKKEEMRILLGTKEADEWIPRLEKLTNNISIIYYFIANKIISRKIEN